MIIQGFDQLINSNIRQEDPEIYDKLMDLLYVHTLDQWLKFKATMNNDQKKRLVKYICRLERENGNQNIFDRHNQFEKKIRFLNFCLTLNYK
jgi:hypothetical protein